jgi:hypothetical protein
VQPYDALIRSKLHELGEVVVLDIDPRGRRRGLSCHVSLLIHSTEGRDIPLPEGPPALTMPPDERVWLDHRQERAPIQ